ncbi:MAG: hypothetical protein DHS20C13_01050 [Thermodesulfobacteriota bacterium]|nr:MAG: hypothetical protein DHS20C13_01050 [Thermodesulfobacteriota bacterium]
MLVPLGIDAWAQGSNRLATSALVIGNSDQLAECAVSNRSNNSIRVDVQLIANGAVFFSAELNVLPNRTSIIDGNLPPGTEFFCKFRTFGNSARIRAAARVIDLSGTNNIIPQRAEAR